mgnify:CR=1 FL=1
MKGTTSFIGFSFLLLLAGLSVEAKLGGPTSVNQENKESNSLPPVKTMPVEERILTSAKGYGGTPDQKYLALGLCEGWCLLCSFIEASLIC